MPTKEFYVAALRQFQAGNFTFRLNKDIMEGLDGTDREFIEVFNDIAASTQKFTQEVDRVSKCGDENEHSMVKCPSGPFAPVADSINQIISDTILPVSELVHIIEAVATGDLIQHNTVSLRTGPYKRIVCAVQGISFLHCF